MNVNTASTFFATGAVIIGAGVVAIVLVWALSPVVPAAGRLLDRTRGWFAGTGLWYAWLMATLATLGSLYYSQIANFIPCEYCWYQRIAMYPLALILGIAAFKRDDAVRRYAYPLTIIGGLIAAYHYIIQQFPSLEVGSCSLVVPCATPYLEKFGFVTIPFMALVSFAAILVALALDRGTSDQTTQVEGAA